MAYDLNDLAVRVTGTLEGGEVWSNSWAFKSGEVSPDPQDAVNALHGFYEELYGTAPAGISIFCSAVDAQCTVLGVGDATVTWEAVVGGNAQQMIPSECALRVSLTGVSGAKGGPFIAGYAKAVLDDGGTLLASYKTAAVAALQSFATELTSSDWTLGLHRPTPQVVEEVVSGRIGEVFDAIRRRRNDLPENYTNVTFA